MNVTRYATVAAAFAVIAAGASAQSADDLLSQGREAYMNYQFSQASRLYSQAKAKAKRSDEFFADKYDTYRDQLSRAQGFLERVEKIEIIDSISVPRREFFEAYRLPASAGSLGVGNALPRRLRDSAAVDYVFTNEGGDYKLWAQPTDSTGYTRLVESSLLTDGNWSDPTPLSDDLSPDCDAIFPFMMADGVTLYYADNGENSIGGYDIMVATRDASDGSFLQPSNLGFPYNSPYDDYLLAIDELNGVGWWATDRNQLDDEITIYVFVTNELRNNYPADDEDIVDYARIGCYRDTQSEDADYEELLATIRKINPCENEMTPEFTLHASDGRVFHRYEELPNAEARSLMERYLDAEKDLRNEESQLRDRRMTYHDNRSASLKEEIARHERRVEQMRAKLKNMRSSLYKAIGR